MSFDRLKGSAILCLLWAVIGPVLILGGCRASLVPHERSDTQGSGGDGSSHALRLRDAVTAFREQDYATAHDLFEHVSHEAEDRALRRQALYGLACVRLVQARSTEEMRRALNTWSIWEEQSPFQFAVEDPRLLSPLLERLPALLEKPARVSGRQTKTPPPPASSQTEWSKVVEEKDREIQELRDRLRALEAIHRELEEKRRGLKE